jgi:hypothetical protein
MAGEKTIVRGGAIQDYLDKIVARLPRIAK